MRYRAFSCRGGRMSDRHFNVYQKSLNHFIDLLSIRFQSGTVFFEYPSKIYYCFLITAFFLYSVKVCSPNLTFKVLSREVFSLSIFSLLSFGLVLQNPQTQTAFGLGLRKAVAIKLLLRTLLLSLFTSARLSILQTQHHYHLMFFHLYLSGLLLRKHHL